MYWYISFLRPPPVSISSSAQSITVTPQVANDLRTEIRYNPTPLSYTWQRTHPLPSAPTPPEELTIFAPPSSTYRALSIPLPTTIQPGDRWRLGLFSVSPGGNSSTHAGPSSELLELSGHHPKVLGVWSEPIHIVRPESQQTGAVRGVNVSAANAGKGKSKGVTNIPAAGSKGKGKGKEKDDGPKQGRIWREWQFPSVVDEGEQPNILRIIEQTSFDLDKKIWDSGLALSSWILMHLIPSPPTGEKNVEVARPPAGRVLELLMREGDLRILELGSGTGLVSIALGLTYRLYETQNNSKKRYITATDLASAIPLMDENLALNGLSNPSASSTSTIGSEPVGDDGANGFANEIQDHAVAVNAKVLDWDQPLPSWVQEEWPELIVAADVTYNTSSFSSLLSTISSLLNPPSPPKSQPLLLLAYKQRDPAERELWTLLKDKGITMLKIDEVIGAEGESGGGTVEIWVGGVGLSC